MNFKDCKRESVIRHPTFKQLYMQLLFFFDREFDRLIILINVSSFKAG